MVQPKQKSIHLEQVELCPNGGSPRAITTQLLAIVREGLVSSERSVVCAVTAILSESRLEITTAEPLSHSQLKAIKTEAKQVLADYDDARATEPKAEINGQREDAYKYLDSGGDPLHFLVVPLAHHERPLGILLVGSFESEPTAIRHETFGEIGHDFSLLLKRIWSQSLHQREQYELLLSKSVDGVILCNANEEILFINNAAKEKLDLPVDSDLQGQRLTDLNADFLTEFLRDALQNGMYEINKVVSNKRNQHTKLLGVHTELLRNQNNLDIGWLISVRDVTLNWQNDQMRSALTVANHEIKTPLNSMRGAVDLLLETDLGPLTTDQRHCLNVVQDDIQRLNRLLADLLDLSRLDEGVQFIDRRKEVSIGLLAKRVLASFQEFANSKNIELKNKVARSIPTFRADRDRLQQVLVNLVENGIKYSMPGSQVEIDAVLQDSMLKVWVKDSGVGIEESDYGNVFLKFKQLDNYPDQASHGYGLGLSIAKDIIKAIGGTIWVESEIGKGSTFFFTIPV